MIKSKKPLTCISVEVKQDPVSPASACPEPLSWKNSQKHVYDRWQIIGAYDNCNKKQGCIHDNVQACIMSSQIYQ